MTTRTREPTGLDLNGADSVPTQPPSARPLIPLGLMLLAAATISPASIYLDYIDMNPSLASFALVAGASLVTLALVVGALRLVFRTELVGVLVGMIWIILTIFGRVLDRPAPEALRLVSLLALLALAVLAARMFPRQIVSWFIVASLLSIAATAMQVALAMTRPSAPFGSGLSGLPVAEATGSFYLIIVDGYGPLVEDADDTRAFRSHLESRSFKVVDDAISNYTATYSSLSNMFSLDHRYRHGSAPPVEMFSAMQGANQMRSVFEQAGWRYVHIESDWTGTRCGPSVTNCVENGWLDDFVWEFAQSSYFGPFLERNVPSPHVSQGMRSLEALRTHGQTMDSGRDFVFAHILLPHPPLQLQANCATVIDRRLLGQMYQLFETNAESTELRTEGYDAQRACLNSELMSVVASLPAEASVVITSDHGPDLRGQLQKAPAIWTDLDIEQRFHIFHASRLPEGCELGADHDLVNLIRSEVSCVAGVSFAPIAPYFEISPFIWSSDDARVLAEDEVHFVGRNGRCTTTPTQGCDQDR